MRISSSAKAAHSKALVALSTAKQLRAAQMGNGACKPACKSAPRECITREAKVQAKNNANSKPPPDQSRRSHGAGHMRRRASGRPATPFVGSKFPTGGGGGAIPSSASSGKGAAGSANPIEVADCTCAMQLVASGCLGGASAEVSVAAGVANDACMKSRPSRGGRPQDGRRSREIPAPPQGDDGAMKEHRNMSLLSSHISLQTHPTSHTLQRSKVLGRPPEHGEPICALGTVLPQCDLQLEQALAIPRLNLE